MNLCVGIDIGNAKTEIAFMDEGELRFVRQPSVVSQLSSKPEANDNDVMNDIYDNITVQTFSDGLKYDGLFFVGSKALLSPEGIRNMPISLGEKSEHDIPLLTSLSMLAAIAVEKHYLKAGSLSKTLTVNVKMATAIPSSEFNKNAARKLEDRFKGEHQINLFVGENTVLVTINVTHCKVTEEGRTAMLAFVNSDKNILKHYNETYQKDLTPLDFSDALALHTDIGDGTSEFVFTKGFNPVPNGSKGMRIGVGHATNNAIELYKEALSNRAGEITRQHFATTLQAKTEKGRIAREQMEKATKAHSSKILDQVSEKFAELTASSADFFFIHGGGSITFKNDLYEQLLKLASDVQGEVVWIPKEFATQMNSKGTYYLAEHLFSK